MPRFIGFCTLPCTIVCSTIEQTISTLKMLTPQPPQYPLTKREKEVIDLLKKGRLYKEIAQNIGISMGSLKQYIHIIYKKLDASNRTEALNIYFQQ